MRSNRSRVAFFGALALALCAVVGITGSTAVAKKGGSNKSATVSAKNIVIPDRAVGATQPFGRVEVPLKVGSKFKGKIVDYAELTYQITSTVAGGPNQIGGKLISPGGRTAALTLPGVQGTQTVLGPLTESPNTPELGCVGPAACTGTNATVFSPYTGAKIQNVQLLIPHGVKMKGTWTVQFTDGTPGGVNTVPSVELKLKPQKPITE